MIEEQIDTVQLARDLRAGSESAKALLYTKYKAYFTKLAYKYVGNVDEADDADANAVDEEDIDDYYGGNTSKKWLLANPDMMSIY